MIVNERHIVGELIGMEGDVIFVRKPNKKNWFNSYVEEYLLDLKTLIPIAIFNFVALAVTYYFKWTPFTEFFLAVISSNLFAVVLYFLLWDSLTFYVKNTNGLKKGDIISVDETVKIIKNKN